MGGSVSASYCVLSVRVAFVGVWAYLEGRSWDE